MTFADVDVEATVKASASAFVGNLDDVEVSLVGGSPQTTLRFSDVRWSVGRGANSLELTYAGGSVGDRALVVPGMPSFEEGFRYFVMLNGSANAFVPITYAENGAWQSVTTRAGDEILVDARGRVLLRTASGRVFAREWFAPATAGADIASTAPDFLRPVSVADFCDWVAKTAGGPAVDRPGGAAASGTGPSQAGDR